MTQRLDYQADRILSLPNLNVTRRSQPANDLPMLDQELITDNAPRPRLMPDSERTTTNALRPRPKDTQMPDPEQPMDDDEDFNPDFDAGAPENQPETDTEDEEPVAERPRQRRVYERCE